MAKRYNLWGNTNAHVEFASDGDWVRFADYDALAARLAEAEAAIERAGRCLAMSNKGAAEALAILMVYKQADSASVQPECRICGSRHDPSEHCFDAMDARDGCASDQPTASIP